jgi:HEAT repeat protein
MAFIPSPDLIGAVTGSVFGYLLEHAGVADRVRGILRRDPTRRAFERALGSALGSFQAQYPQRSTDLFDSSFLQHEGAPVLAQFLLRDGDADPFTLAARWADSLAIHRPDQRTIYTRELEPVAATFLDLFARALNTEDDLRELNDSRALERLAAAVMDIRDRMTTGRATPGTRRDYLRWLIDRNSYLDPRGTYQTQRQVQLKLDTIYVSLHAQRDDEPSIADKTLIDQELADLERNLAGMSAEEAEDQRENLLALFEHKQASGQASVSEILELASVVARSDCLVILGDPGSGKSTLLRYLALKHAEAQLYGLADTDDSLGRSQFPILIRIADYAEFGMPRQFSTFLAEYCAMHECPASGVADLLSTELERGGCLVLLDGLDEIVSADQRRDVVERIDEFVGRHVGAGNHFVITSRIAGYRNAPLNPTFDHFIVQEMDELQIRTFLERWCRAVEDAQTPELAVEMRVATAQREIDGIMDALQNRGVRRLAANPLLLRTLALIHRTGAQLPQKRVELYKLATDTLIRTWRTAQGVPETALVKEEFLTPLLSRLAYWMHTHKTTGIATEREVYAVLGEEWAEINDLDWDVDRPTPAITDEIHKFLAAVREHTGLFVERAPKRYGFMHMTFEEYYAARYLVASPRTRAQLIRQHLHNPRWDESILLALGFVGLDSSKDATELLETAILAQGEEAKALILAPSQYEELLGRDYLFALRCLGDQIPIRTRVVRVLFERLANEILFLTGSARFQRFRQILQERLSHLKGSADMQMLVQQLAGAVKDPQPKIRYRAVAYLGDLVPKSSMVARILIGSLRDPDHDVRYMAAASLGRMEELDSQILDVLMASAHGTKSEARALAATSLGQCKQNNPIIEKTLVALLQDSRSNVRLRAVESLHNTDKIGGGVLSALLNALNDKNVEVRSKIVENLGNLRKSLVEVDDALIKALYDENHLVRYRAAAILGRIGNARKEVIDGLLKALEDTHPEVNIRAIRSLERYSANNPQVIEATKKALGHVHAGVRLQATVSLSKLGWGSPEVIEELIRTLSDSHDGVRFQAAYTLSRIGRSNSTVSKRLLEAVGNTDERVSEVAAVALGRLGQSTPEILSTLTAALRSPRSNMQKVAASSLARLGQSSNDILNLLRETVEQGKPWSIRRDAAYLLGQSAKDDDHIIKTLYFGLVDTNSDVRTACVDALTRIAHRFPISSDKIGKILIQAIDDPYFDKLDEVQKSRRSGHDYAYDALWLLVTGNQSDV